MTKSIIATAKDEIEMFERPSVATSKKLIARVEELEAVILKVKTMIEKDGYSSDVWFGLDLVDVNKEC